MALLLLPRISPLWRVAEALLPAPSQAPLPLVIPAVLSLTGSPASKETLHSFFIVIIFSSV